jgi:hypothetical protein
MEDSMSTTPQPPVQPGTEQKPPTPAAYPNWYQKQYYADDPRRKSPALAALLSLMPGLGQVYIGYYQHGFINVVVVAGIIALLSAGRLGGGMDVLAAFFLAFFWMYNVIDAARRASLYNQMLSGLGPTQLPEDIQTPNTRGSLIGGVALVILGALMFMNTKFNFSLDWLEDWWPIALVAAGAYLIYVWSRERTKINKA